MKERGWGIPVLLLISMVDNGVGSGHYLRDSNYQVSELMKTSRHLAHLMSKVKTSEICEDNGLKNEFVVTAQMNGTAITP